MRRIFHENNQSKLKYTLRGATSCFRVPGIHDVASNDYQALLQEPAAHPFGL